MYQFKSQLHFKSSEMAHLFCYFETYSFSLKRLDLNIKNISLTDIFLFS